MDTIVTFSVIMPCYNSEAYVITALESILHQTYPHWELIAVNDGSVDNTLNILNDYAQKDSRIKVYSKENGGYVSAVNMGLDRITGDYFLFLGSDDRLSTDLFKSLYESISEVSCLPDCIAFRTQKVQGDMLKGPDSYTNFQSLCFAENTSIHHYIEEHPQHAAIFSCRDTSKCFKTALLHDLRYFGKYGIDADGIFSMLFCHGASSFLSVPIDGYFWTLRDNSVSATTSPQKEMDRILNWERFFNELSQLNINEITSAEKLYAATPRNALAGLSMNIKHVFLYHHFIRTHAQTYKNFATAFAPQYLTAPIKIIAVSPLLFYIFYTVKKVFKKLLSRQ